MAGKRKSFLNYNDARTIVVALALTSMQDWIAWAKGKDEKGNPLRPADIPSNPWNVYKEELAAMNPPQKFSINEFIGNKLPRKSRATGDATPKAPRKPKIVKAVQTTSTPASEVPVADEPEAPAVTNTERLSFVEAKAEIQKLNLTSRDAFNDLKRNNMLPVGVPRNPDKTYLESGWNGWGDFLGNTRTVPAKAESTF